MSKAFIYDLDLEKINSLFKEWGQPSYRAKQLWEGLYRQLWSQPDDLSTFPKELRQKLADEFSFSNLHEAERLFSSDGQTTKVLFTLPDGQPIETVLMRYEERNTLCISTQAGCAMGCVFCATGQMGFERNLKGEEIVAQVLHIARLLRERGEHVTNVVFMGMGEPLANYAALVTSLRILTDAKLGLGYSPRRITVSTVGLVPGIEKLGRENLKVNVAISLHAATDEVRSKLMPVNRSFNLVALMAALKKYPLAPRQRIFFEYVMLDGVNDSPEDARQLVKLLRGLRAKVNLIPFNDWEGAPFQRPPLQRILAFQSILFDAGVTTTVRWSKGEDIGAACGQLREPVPA